MSRLMPVLFFLAMISLPAHSAAVSSGADAVTGLWEVEEGDGHIQIYRCGEKYCGSIAWLKEPDYPPNDKGKMAGKPLLDRGNPQRELRNRPLMGLKIMDGYTFRGNNLWDDGTIYNNENGKRYSSKITLKSHERLELRGFIGIPLLGGSTVWRRVK